MTIAATNKFRKLWGKINEDLPPGDYILTIKNIYDINKYGAAKAIVFSNTNAFGQKNTVLAAAYFCAAIFNIILIVILVINWYI